MVEEAAKAMLERLSRSAVVDERVVAGASELVVVAGAAEDVVGARVDGIGVLEAVVEVATVVVFGPKTRGSSTTGVTKSFQGSPDPSSSP